LLYTDHQGRLHRLKGSSKSVGGHFTQSTREAYSFDQVSLGFSEVSAVYLATDGFQDQFGGTKDKKFLSRRLRELLVEVQGLPMKKQQEQIREAFFNWKGNTSQTDDVTVMGFCLPK
jgi:serine phosphatase RsbU (regulator of sigma subunit)